MKTKKSWAEKLATNKDLPKTMVIPSPCEVDALMKQVPRGRLVTINELRAALAAKHKVNIRLPPDNGDFFMDCRARRRRGGSGRRKTLHAILAHAQDRRRNQPEISRRG